jgi:hypothetical protein
MVLIGYWPLNEESGTTAYDYSGNENNGDANGPGPSGTGTGTGPVGQPAYVFDGGDDYIALDMFFEDGDSLPVFSVSVWFKTSYSGKDFSDNWSFLDFDRSEWFNVYLTGSSGEIAFSGSDGTNDYFDIAGSTSVNDGKWHQGVVVYNSNENRVVFYMDGQQDGVFNYDTMNSISDTTTRYGFIGDGSEASSYDGDRNNVHYDGSMGEIRFYYHALTPAEVQYLYQVCKRGRQVTSGKSS